MATDVDAPLKLSHRQVVRKGLSGLRSDGLIPAVIHNHGQPSIHVMGAEGELVKVYRVAGKHHPLQLQVEDKEYLALIKDVHFNPVKRRMQHIVFQAIKRDEKVEAEIPIRLEGEIPAEKIGLMLLHQLDHVEVEALPKDLPDELVIDGSKLAELHDKVTVADLTVPEGVTLLVDMEHPIATVVETRAQIAEDEATADETEEAEGEGEEDEESQEATDGESTENTDKKD